MKKGRILFRTFSFCCKADFRSVNLISEVIFFNELVLIASCLKARFEVGGIAMNKMISLSSWFSEVSAILQSSGNP